MIKKCKVEPYAEKYICDNCRKGEMEPTGENVWLTDPPKFKHRCNICNEEIFLTEKHPVIKYRIID